MEGTKNASMYSTIKGITNARTPNINPFTSGDKLMCTLENVSVLTIKNFRFWPDLRLEIPQNGCCHLAGKSGSGKTTIFEAIKWLLYGKVQSIAPSDNPKASTMVMLEVPSHNFQICRQTSPIRIVVIHDGITMEAQDAQEYIDFCYGNKKFWMSSSYIVQKKRNSLLSSSEADKVLILSAFAYGELDPAAIIETLKSADKSLVRDIQELDTKIQMTLNYLNSVTADWQKIATTQVTNDMREKIASIPRMIVERDNIKMIEYNISLFDGKMNNIQSQLASLVEPIIPIFDGDIELAKKCTTYQRTVQEYRRITQQLESLGKPTYEVTFEEINSAVSAKSVYDSFINSMSFIGIDPSISIDDLKKQGREATVKINNSAAEIQKRFQSIKSQKCKFVRDKLDSMKLIPHREQQKEIDPSVFEETRNNISNLRAKIDLLHKTKNSECPWCKESITIDSQLKICKGMNEDVSTLVLDLNNAETNLHQGTLCNNKIKLINNESRLYNENLLRDISSLERQLSDLGDVADVEYDESKILSDQEVNSLKYKIVSLTKAVQCSRPPPVTSNVDEMNRNYELSGRIRSVKQCLPDVSSIPEEVLSMNTNDIDLHVNNLSTYSNSMNQYNNSMNQYNSNKERLTNESLSVRPQESAVTSFELTEKINKFTQGKTYIDRVDILITPYNNLNVYRSQREELIKQLSDAREMLDIAKKSEYESLSLTTALVNGDIGKMCSELFEDPIDVNLRLSKKLKNNNEVRSVGFTVKYRNSLHNKLDSMSGGEGDRISLALTIALHKIHNKGAPPILLVDETMNSVESTLLGKIIKIINKLSPGIRLIILHNEAATGYVKTIHLNDYKMPDQ